VTPNEGEIPTGSLGRHGGNMDVKEIKKGTKLYLPVLTRGALFAIGDVHAVQGDGELCVSAIEVAGEALLKFNLIKGKTPEWPTLQTEEGYALLACGESLDEAAKLATEAAVKAFMRQYRWSFEKAYMFGSLAVDLRINQVVDPKKGVRAVISRNFITMESLLI
jgi:amidase